jgi:basic membrane protein A and related proteins
MKKVFIAVVLVSGVALVLTAAIIAKTTADKKHVGMVEAGPKNDRSFFQGHYIGLTAAKKKFGLTTAVVDNVTDPQAQIDAFKNLAQSNSLVIGVGGALATPMGAVAKQFPDVQFVESAGVPKAAPNVHYVLQTQTALGYVSGYVAAKLSKTHKIGFVGGALIPPTIEGQKGFKAGAKAGGAKVVSTIVGSFSDPVKGKTAAAAQIAAGADVLYNFLDAGAPGVIQAIKESGKDIKSIGVITQKCYLGKAEIGDSLAFVDKLTYNVVRDFEAGKLTNKIYSLEDPTVERWSACPGNARAAAIAKTTTAKINAGKIKLPK